MSISRKTGPFRVAIMLGLSALGMTACAANRIEAGNVDGCAPVAEGSIVESKAFTLYENRRSHLPPAALNPTGADLPEVPLDARTSSDLVDGLPLRWAVVGPPGSVYQYFVAEPISKDLTVEQFVAMGGIELDRDPLIDGASVAEVLDSLGDRAVGIGVGNYSGALTWADPMANGIRTHNLYWSDGKYSYSLIADRSASELVNLGRTLVCS